MENTMRNNKLDEESVLDEFADRPDFFLVIQVTNIDKSLDFYGEVLGCKILDKKNLSFTVDFFGFRLEVVKEQKTIENRKVTQIGSRFGLLLEKEDWHRALSHLTYIGVDLNESSLKTPLSNLKKNLVFSLRDPSDNIIELRVKPA